ncbi:hypothetical protein FRB90_001930 [Tulasnella sp. 427]|nr:hypothetical protein FRB90_001930 [Tulasnella sp. 427]
MPHVTLEGSDISLNYRSNFSKFNPSKSTILLLHGVFFSVDFLSPQFEDERFAGKYNMIAFDQLSCGQTINSTDGRKDAYVEAAAIIVALEKLGVRGNIPFHIFAAQGISEQIALRLAQLWSERVSSLFFCGVGGPEEEMQWFGDVFQMWGYATSQAELDDTIAGLLVYTFGENTTADNRSTTTVEEKDEAVAYWLSNIPPNKRSKVFDVGNAFSQPALSDAELAEIKQPVMIQHGDAHAVYPITVAEDLVGKLKGANGGKGARLKVVPGGADSIQYPKHFASRYVNPTFLEFLHSVEPEDPNDPTAGARSRSGTLSSTNPPTTPQEEAAVLKPALEKLAKIKGIDVQGRNPTSVWSFSCVSEEERQKTDESLQEFAAGQENAFSPPLDNKGRPLTKWSERSLEALLEPTSPTRPDDDDGTNASLGGFGSTMLVLGDAGEGSIPFERRPSTDWMKMVEKIEETTTTTTTTS